MSVLGRMSTPSLSGAIEHQFHRFYSVARVLSLPQQCLRDPCVHVLFMSPRAGTMRSRPPAATALARFSRQDNVQGDTIRPRFVRIRPQARHVPRVRMLESVGSIALPSVSICSKSLQGAAACLIRWQVVRPFLYRHERDATHAAFCLK